MILGKTKLCENYLPIEWKVEGKTRLVEWRFHGGYGDTRGTTVWLPAKILSGETFLCNLCYTRSSVIKENPAPHSYEDRNRLLPYVWRKRRGGYGAG